MTEQGGFMKALAFFLFLLLFPAAALLAQDDGTQEGGMKTVGGQVTYVTSTQVYGSIGRKHGLRENDTVRVLQKGKSVGVLMVAHLASSSFSANILSKTGTIVKGDSVVARVPRIVVPPRTELTGADTAKMRTVQREAPPALATLEAAASDSREFRIHGRVSMQYYALFNSRISGAAFTQPAARVNLMMDNIMELPLQLQYYSNHRYDARSDDARRGVTQDRWRHRFYQFALNYGEDDGPVRATVGRFVPYTVGGIGTVDGGMLRVQNDAWEAGAIAGSQPGYQNSELNFRDQKVAAYGAYRSGGNAAYFRSSAAFAQTYRDGAVDRGYFYLVNSLSLGGKVTLYQNASLDLYDADDGSGHFQPHLTDLYLSTTWRPIRWVSTTASYANRRSIFFLRSYAGIPDSLFRDARLQNYRLSAGVNIPGGMYASLTASLRTQDNSSETAQSLAGRFTWSNFLESRSNVYLLGSWADNIFNTSTSYGLEINRDLLEGLYTALRLQQYRYTYSGDGSGVNRTTVSLDAYYRLSRLFYLSLSYEHYWEGVVTNDRIYTEISMRLR
ncbi:hypothetical protein KQI65_16525 [bacterium]|nr:hypothetical protein [bacterium]